MSESKLSVRPCTELQMLDVLSQVESKSTSPRSFVTQSIDSLLDHLGLDGGVAVVDLPSDPTPTIIVRGPAGPQTDSLLATRSSASQPSNEALVEAAQFADPPHTWIRILLLARGKRLGRLVLVSVERRSLKERETALLHTVARRLGLTLDHLNQRRFSQARIAQLAAINRVSTAIAENQRALLTAMENCTLFSRRKGNEGDRALAAVP